MRPRNQNGYLRCVKRKHGPAMWEFLWREDGPAGKRIRRTQVIGTVDQYPTRESASAAANGRRTFINQDLNREQCRPVPFGDLVDHYVQTELINNANEYAKATKMVYPDFLSRWIVPAWKTRSIHDFHAPEVEKWLKRLRRLDGKPLAASTRTKNRNIMSRVFNHAITHEWLPQGKNPITMVRVKAGRREKPAVLEPFEIHNLLAELPPLARVLILLDATSGLRRGEVVAIKWCDIDFNDLVIDIQRSFYAGVIGDCKSETSKQLIPLDPDVAVELKLWQEQTAYSAPDDFVFASSKMKGRSPLWPGTLMTRIIKPAAVRAGITKRVSWHTFRRSFSTIMKDAGVNDKVNQDLMRHASYRTTFEVYCQSTLEGRREGQRKVMQLIKSEGAKSRDPMNYTADMPASMAAECEALVEDKLIA